MQPEALDFHQRQHQNKTPQTQTSRGTLVEQPSPEAYSTARLSLGQLLGNGTDVGRGLSPIILSNGLRLCDEACPIPSPIGTSQAIESQRAEPQMGSARKYFMLGKSANGPKRWKRLGDQRSRNRRGTELHPTMDIGTTLMKAIANNTFLREVAKSDGGRGFTVAFQPADLLDALHFGWGAI